MNNIFKIKSTSRVKQPCQLGISRSSQFSNEEIKYRIYMH